MARFLIYNFSGELDDISHLFPNERLARIASIIRHYQHDAEIIDRANFTDLQAFGAEYLCNLSELGFYEFNAQYTEKLDAEADFLLGRGYDTVFMNLWHGTGFKFTMDLAARLKTAQPNLRIYGVGQKVDWFKEHILTLANNALDGLVTGLGYNAIAAIVQGEDIARCPNTIVMDHGVPVINAKMAINVDDYPIGCYDEAVYHQIANKLPLHTISLSNQACPNHCVFCIRPENYGHENIKRDIGRVLDEMRESYHTYGIRYFRFEDSTPPPQALTEISKAIMGSELNGQVYFSAFSRIDTNATEDFAMLKAAGCLALFFGVESLDDGNLLCLRKGITYDGIRRTMTLAHDVGIHTLSNFIVPIPGKTEASLESCFQRLAESADLFDSVLTLPAGVYPPTEWGKHPERYGIELDEDYLERVVTFPIKYLFPLELWPPLPFRYAMLGKRADEVTSQDITAVHNRFQQRVRQELGKPPIPDYGFLLADYLGTDPVSTTRTLVGHMIARDYAGLAALLLPEQVTV